ncbi:MAG: M56 family metallopeptidase [Bacteroidales bacterium]|nr:M56 family metallopeptidase [Bacteroidales bacterium]
MQNLVSYFLQSSVVMGIAYLIYRFVYQKEGYYIFNRVYLLSAFLLALVLPLIPFNIDEFLFGNSPTLSVVQYPIKAVNAILLGEVTIFAHADDVSATPAWHVSDWMMIVYLLGLLWGFLRLAVRIFQLGRVITTAEKQQRDGLTFVMLPDDSPVFSFFHYVFISQKELDQPESGQQIIEHEQQHAFQLHSLDMLFAELVSVVFWFNPFSYLLKNNMRENHEFMADKAVLTRHPDAGYYRMLLINHSSILENQLLTHNFSYLLLKRRLFMMKNVKNPVRMVAKLLWIFIGSALALVACSDATKQVTLPENVVKIDIPEAPQLPKDSVNLIFGFNMNERKADFIARLGNGQSCKLEVFNKKNELIATIFDTQMGPGDYRTTWNITPGVDYFSYVFTAGDKRMTGNSYIDPSKTYNEETGVYTVVDQMPEFHDGMGALMTFLSSNITYPEQAKKDTISGRVFINFIIEKDGSVSNVKVLRGIGGGCDEEAVRVVSSMPKWKPGLQNGEAVRVAYNLPIKFALR